jgi:hypothetical protein
MKRYLAPLLDKIEAGEIDPSFVITHRRPLEDGPELYNFSRQERRLHQDRLETLAHSSEERRKSYYASP